MTDNLEIITGAKGVGSSTLDDFRDAGFTSAEEVGSRTPEELADEVKGVGYSTAISVLKFLEGEGYRDTSNRDDDLERLVELLQDLFEFDNQDRDFGIYKLMNANREKIEKYIKEDLIDKIENEVANLHDEFGSRPEEEIKEEVINELGGDAFDGNSLSQEALNEIEERTEGPSEEELENIRSEIYNHVYQFLSNYYDSGDFITQRKRTNRSEPYSIPYDGSNTHFHWVTKNQYYAKTSEQFTRFTFNTGGYKMCFKTVEDELEGSGVGNSEYLIMDTKSDIEVKEDSIIIPFYHRMIGDDDLERFDISASTHNKQSAMNDKFSDILRDYLDDEGISVSGELINEKIDEYTTRNQNDFFIHKNIENFLTEELEEYVKSKVFTYDPDAGVDSVSELSMEKGRIINDIVKDIISFVSQLEEFKRKLFEKKKFVKNAEKLVQVKNIPEDSYEIILDNEDQLSDWEESFNIDSSNLEPNNMDTFPYSEMMVDTSYFNEDITTGEELQNKLVKGDNYQALNFLKEKYENSVKCIYIDPPYNTGNANFAYKDNYQRPTWLAMIYDRLEASKNLLSDNGVVFVSIDYNEYHRLKILMEKVFGEDNYISTFVWKRRSGANDAGNNVSVDHEYVVAFSKSGDVKFMGEEKTFDTYSNPDNDPRGDWAKTDLTGNDTRDENPDYYYPIEHPNEDVEYYPNEDRVWASPKHRINEMIDDDLIVFPEGENGMPTKKRFKKDMERHKPVSSWVVTNSVNDDVVESEEDLRNISILTTGLTSKGTREIKSIFGRKVYDYPKPHTLIKDLVNQVANDGDIVLDFFSGSGTTAQAVQELNRERDEQVNYILVEMLDEAFNITKERVKRVAYTKDWKDGNPQIDKEKKKNMNLTEDGDEDVFEFNTEYIELESYEEALDAIQFKDTQKTINSFNKTTLNYLLEFGIDEDPVFLDSNQLSNPLDYKLSGSIESENIDIITTFNYLIGLEDWTKYNKSTEDTDYTIFEGKVDSEDVLIVWRHNNNNVSYQKEQDMLDYGNYDKIYINGDSSITDSQPISTVFKRKMRPNKGDML